MRKPSLYHSGRSFSFIRPCESPPAAWESKAEKAGQGCATQGRKTFLAKGGAESNFVIFFSPLDKLETVFLIWNLCREMNVKIRQFVNFVLEAIWKASSWHKCCTCSNSEQQKYFSSTKSSLSWDQQFKKTCFISSTWVDEDQISLCTSKCRGTRRNEKTCKLNA